MSFTLNMNKKLIYTSQTRLDFDIDRLVEMGIDKAYVSPFTTNNECLCEPDVILSNLEELARKAEAAAKKGIEVYPFFVTINHPEGNFEIPARYRRQRNMDGSQQLATICFRDETRQEDMIRFATKAAELGFGRLAFDDDLRDAFCYCDEHLNGFEPFRDKDRHEIDEILNGILTNPEHEKLRQEWYRYKYAGMCDYARRIEQAVHNINPRCQIGICNSAKRCQDFSGRDPVEWLKLFSTEQAPAFVRLCGECYDDDIMHLVQSTGWHQYFNRYYPEKIERMAEISSVPPLAYRSPGAVLLETKAVIAATAIDTIHWAWTEEFDNTALGGLIGPEKEIFKKIAVEVQSQATSPLALYIGGELGPYMPINISVPYGATHDPVAAYNIMSLVGLPIVALPGIPASQPSVLCSGYISREMIFSIDEYVQSGGVAVVDAKAAQCYRVYGGKVDFEIKGPVSLHRYELSPQGLREDMISECPPDSIYLIESDTSIGTWTGYDVSGNITGVTTAVIACGKGRLIVLGYDLSRTKTALLCQQWRQRMLEMLSIAGVDFPVYWSGPAAIQCLYHADKVALANYNSNPVSGQLMTGRGDCKKVSIGPHELKIVSL